VDISSCRTSLVTPDALEPMVILMVTLDAVGNDGGAGNPGFLVPAATELGWHDVKQSVDEVVDVSIRDVHILVDLVQTFEVDLERLRVVEEGHGDVDTGQGAQSERAELARVGVVTADLLKALLDGGGEVEGGSPDSDCEVLPCVSVRVGARPLGLDLNRCQVIARRSQ